MNRYSRDPLTDSSWRAPRGRSTELAADPGVVVEDVETGFVGAVVAVEKSGGMHVVHLEDRRGKVRAFSLGPGFLVDGKPVTLTPPTPRQREVRDAGGPPPGRTASGSVAVAGVTARVARGSRIFVEGKHDAELVEKVWGDDLRIEGVVVEMLNGVDDLAAVIDDFAPDRSRRLGVLVDHLVPGSKESRLVDAAQASRYAEHVKILGHPYVDVWQSVRPERLGLKAWPVIPRDVEWKRGILAHLGWPCSSQVDVADGWRRILAQVRTYADLEPALLGRVEELIDFVTEPV